MNVLIIIGIILGAAVMITDRFIHRVPDLLAIILYSLGVILVIAGMIVAKTR